MRNALALLVFGLLAAPGGGAANPPPKEWQPLIDAAINAFKKKDAAAFEKLLMSYTESALACAKQPPTAKEKAQMEELDKDRLETAKRVVDDCTIMEWQTAKFVSASGGGPPAKPSKCDKLQFAEDIVLVYKAGDLEWSIRLSPVALNGKRLISNARCNADIAKK